MPELQVTQLGYTHGLLHMAEYPLLHMSACHRHVCVNLGFCLNTVTPDFLAEFFQALNLFKLFMPKLLSIMAIRDTKQPLSNPQHFSQAGYSQYIYIYIYIVARLGTKFD